MPVQKQWTDQRIENIVGNLLRAGVLLSAVVVLCGGVLYLIKYGHAPADYRIFRGEPTDLKSVSGIVRDASVLPGRFDGGGASLPSAPFGTMRTSPRATRSPGFSSKTMDPERPVASLSYSPSQRPASAETSERSPATGTLGEGFFEE